MPNCVSYRVLLEESISTVPVLSWRQERTKEAPGALELTSHIMILASAVKLYLPEKCIVPGAKPSKPPDPTYPPVADQGKRRGVIGSPDTLLLSGLLPSSTLWNGARLPPALLLRRTGRRTTAKLWSGYGARLRQNFGGLSSSREE